MTKIILDTSAWIEYLLGTERGEKIRDVLEKDNEVYIIPIILAEIISKTIRAKMQKELVISPIKSMAKIITDSDIAITAGEIHGLNKISNPNSKLSFADAFIIATARKINATIITYDNDFRDFKEAKVI